jgi:hypothetical protein
MGSTQAVLGSLGRPHWWTLGCAHPLCDADCHAVRRRHKAQVLWHGFCRRHISTQTCSTRLKCSASGMVKMCRRCAVSFRDRDCCQPPAAMATAMAAVWWLSSYCCHWLWRLLLQVRLACYSSCRRQHQHGWQQHLSMLPHSLLPYWLLGWQQHPPWQPWGGGRCDGSGGCV